MNTLTDKLRNELFPRNLVLCGYRGSYAQNTYIPNTDPDSIDDIDLMGVYIAPPEYYVGLGRGRVYTKAVERFIGEWDVVSYEIRKFFNLLLKANPNVMSLVWLNKKHYLPAEFQEYGNLIVKNRDAFSSKLAYNSFLGYANGQLHKMEHFKFEGYMGDKRKKLVEKHGYDTKNASHLIRLLRMGIEFLETGSMTVHRTDANELKAIKIGLWPLEKVKKEADILFKKAKEAQDKSLLPDKPNFSVAEDVLMTIITDYLERRRGAFKNKTQ